MKFRSTRKKSPSVTISDAILRGLAEDGGLFVPQEWPTIKISPNLVDLPFADFAAEVLNPFFEGDLLKKHLPQLCAKAFDFPIPLARLDDHAAVLELFHGPTSAFKDFGARFLALCLNRIPNTDPKPRMVLVGTSGDTGGAVAAAFAEFTKIPVTILYPHKRISPRQEKQLTAWGQQVHGIAVRGSFDDCQKMVKSAFASDWWQQRYQLISANSINLARLLPQMAGFAFASLQYQKQFGRDAGVIVPSGNSGNSAAALWAQKLGFPIRKVIFAHNANRVVHDYFQTGQWKSRATVATIANAMDVGEPSNFERIRDLYPDLARLKTAAGSDSVDDDSIRATILKEWKGSQRLWCPHSAVAVRTRERQKGGDWILTATAHPAKFETILEPLLGTSVPVPAKLKELLSKPSLYYKIDTNLTSLQKLLTP